MGLDWELVTVRREVHTVSSPIGDITEGEGAGKERKGRTVERGKRKEGRGQNSRERVEEEVKDTTLHALIHSGLPVLHFPLTLTNTQWISFRIGHEGLEQEI